MELLSSVGAIGAVMKGAASLVKELKRPQEQSVSFAEVLRQDLALNAVMAPEKEAKERSETFLRAHDVDGSGSLNRAESGMDAQTFKKWDLDKNGEIGSAELLGAFLNHADTIR